MVALVRGRGHQGFRPVRRMSRSVRRVMAAAMGPLLAAGGLALPPVAVTAAVAAGVTAAAVWPAAIRGQ